MSINVWFTATDNTYHVQFNGKHYTRTAYTSAKELIESLLPNLVIVAKHDARKAA